MYYEHPAFAYVDEIYHVKPYSSHALLEAIETGPVSVTIEADNKVFQFYKSGILNSNDCGTTLDHAVTAVGYGKDDEGYYYIV